MTLEGAARWTRRFSPTDLHRDLGLYCAGAGRAHGPLPEIAQQTLRHHGAVLIETGTGWYEDARTGGRRAVEAPALLWLFPGLPHGYGPAGPDWRVSWVLFGGTATRSYERLGCLSRDAPVQELAPRSPIPELLERLLARCTGRSPLRATDTAALLHRLITEAGSLRGDEEQETAGPSLVDRLRDQACTTMSIREHAHRLAVSVDDLRTAVRAIDVDGPKELVLQTRMARAMTLLEESAMPVGTVAREVGYQDPAYFSRLFTRRIGISPSRFRHRHRTAAGSPGAERWPAADGAPGSSPEPRIRLTPRRHADR